MKTSLLVLALLVHIVHSFRDTRAETLQLFNSARSLIAKNAQIANMVELEYLPRLESVLYHHLRETEGCPDTRIVYDDSDSEVLKEIHLNVKFENMKDEQSALKLFGGVGKTHMGYVESKCMVTGEEVHSYAFYTMNNGEIHGPPGSQCPQGSRATSDGLCGKRYKRKEGKFEKMGKTAGQLVDQGLGMVAGLGK
ncbi:hypothetical protein B9Z55_026749 [Caenorhabditis nigoni]|uniref:SCP domain-containing protein n=1 Tax=Caenorhabditis nigoni TaxID=1611254 RepID=A0A2G5SHU8_9PELO|nr:hypothetical protein B9Z55_026749 [Caenorhabditis nigoni]